MIITQIAPYGTMVLLILPDDKNISQPTRVK
jgi:hypothetical protein